MKRTFLTCLRREAPYLYEFQKNPVNKAHPHSKTQAQHTVPYLPVTPTFLVRLLYNQQNYISTPYLEENNEQKRTIFMGC